MSQPQRDVAIPKSGRRTWYGLMPTVPLVLALLGLLVLYRRLVAGWVLAGGDLHTYFFPYWVAAARAFQAGKLPLWNPYLFAGVPLLANSQVGVFYPLNWPLWLLSGSSLAGMTRTLHWSVLLHLGLALVNAFVLARRLGVSPWGAALSGLLYAGGGYLGVHVEHLNQLQGLAWLPLVLLGSRRETGDGRRGGGQGARGKRKDVGSKMQETRHFLPAPISVFALAMIVLAGHTQMAFIAVVGLVVWRIGLRVAGYRKQEAGSKSGEWRIENGGSSIRHQCAASPWDASRITYYVPRFILSLLPFAIAGLIAAAQLLPTVELSRFSVRSGGLPWREAVSFSVRPWELPRALLPPYLVPPLLPEGIAYLGVVGLALAGWGAWRAVRSKDVHGVALIVLGGMGVFLALGGYNPLYLAVVRLGVPGFVHFRAPSRFLALYVLAASLLAGMAAGSARRLRGWARYLVPAMIAGLAFAELWIAAERMPHAAATAPRAYTDLRPATAHLVAATRADDEVERPAGRFLSISKTLFDAGDEADIEAVYGATLSSDALWAYQVAAKQREVLVPNLPLAFAVPAVDGYDGGLLPLRHYVDFSRLFLPEGTLDGRLRENLQAIPDGRWLSLLGVRFLITDKTGDAWVDDVFYDRQFQPRLAGGETLILAWLPHDFEVDALGLLYTGMGDVVLTDADGSTIILALPARESEDGAYRMQLGEVTRPKALSIRSVGELALSGASLIDERTGAFYPIVLSDRFRLVHSGDVKIYENLDRLPRAFLVHDVVCAASDEEALTMMRDGAFDPGTQVVLSDCGDAVAGRHNQSDAAAVTDSATLVRYEDTRVVVDVSVVAPGMLVVTDAWYPGWRVELLNLDSQAEAYAESEIVRGDVLFRAVPVEPGRWRVTFTYRPVLLYVGIGVSVLGIAVFLWYVAWWRKSKRMAGANDESTLS